MEFLAVKICYFFSAGSKYTLMAFLVVFLTENGLNVAQAGQVTAVRYIVEVIGAVVLNVLTDRFKKYAKIILMIYITNSSIMILLMPWIPKVTEKAGILFSLYLVCNSLIAFFEGGIIPAIDARAMAVTKAVSEKSFIWQRIWLSIGLGSVPFITGLSKQRAKNTIVENQLIFLIITASNIFLLIGCFLLFTNENRSIKNQKNAASKVNEVTYENNDVTKATSPNEICTSDVTSMDNYGVHKDSLSRLQCNSILKSFKNWQNVITLFSYFFIGVGFVFQYSFVFLLLEEELNASSTMMGLGALIQALSEVIASKIGIAISKYLKHEFSAFAVSYFGFGLGFLSYYFVKHIAVVFAINSLIGCSYAVFLYPAANMIYRKTDNLSRGVMYAIALASLNGVGGCVAGLVGGYLFKKFKGRKTFFTGSGLFLSLGVLYCLIYFVTIANRRRKYAGNSGCNTLDKSQTENQTVNSAEI